MRRAAAAVVIVAATLLWTTAVTFAFEARVVEFRAVGPLVRATIDLRDVFSQKFSDILTAGGSLHVRIQTELWEDRPLWDRVVRPALVSVFRIVRDPTTAQIVISDTVGLVQAAATAPNPLSLRVDVAQASAVSSESRYYLRLVATVGTLNERDIREAGDAAFGQDDGTVSIGKMGRLVLNAVLQATDYLQSVTSEATTQGMSGRDILKK
jgi:hypothetical protein